MAEDLNPCAHGAEPTGAHVPELLPADGGFPCEPPAWLAAVPPVLECLIQAWYCATDVGADPWDFAVEFPTLQSCGLTATLCRWLESKGYVEHRREQEPANGAARSFLPAPRLRYSEASCFILTGAGEAFARQTLFGSRPPVDRAADALSVPRPSVSGDGELPPVWDPDRKELRVGGQLIKQFKLPSPNQETILMCFEEEGWPARIDNPLPPQQGLDNKVRLHATIKSLNRHQKHRLIRFMGDGNGEGILWGWIEPGNGD